MRELLAELTAALGRGLGCVYCAVVETRGSTPQKAGATMLVYPDGSQAGTLGGGCVEAEVKRRAIDILAKGAAEVVSFQLDNDYGWDDGLICGGRMQVLVEPFTPQRDANYFQRLDALLSAGAGCIEAIVFDGEKSGLKTPASYLIDGHGQLLAAMGDERATSVPGGVEAELPNLADRPRP